MSTSATQIFTEATIKAWGTLGLVALFMFGAYLYLLNKDRLEHERYKVSAAQIDKLIVVIEKQHTVLAGAMTANLQAIRKQLTRVDQRAETYGPVILGLAKILDSQQQKMDVAPTRKKRP